MYGTSLDNRYRVFDGFRYDLRKPAPALFEVPLYVVAKLSEVSILSVFNGFWSLPLTVLLVKFWLISASFLHLLLLIWQLGPRGIIPDRIIRPEMWLLVIETLASANLLLINPNLHHLVGKLLLSSWIKDRNLWHLRKV